MWTKTEKYPNVSYEFKPINADGTISTSSPQSTPIIIDKIIITKSDNEKLGAKISVHYKQSERFNSCIKGSALYDWDNPVCHPEFVDSKEHAALNSLCEILRTTDSSTWWRGDISFEHVEPGYSAERLAFLKYVSNNAPAMSLDMHRQLYLDCGVRRSSDVVYSEIQNMAAENIKLAKNMAIFYQHDGYTGAIYCLAEYIAATRNPAAAFDVYAMVPDSSDHYREAQAKCCDILLEKLASESLDTKLKDEYEQQLLTFALNCRNEQLATSCFNRISRRPAAEPETPIAFDAKTFVSLALEARELRFEIQQLQAGKRMQRSIFSPLPQDEEAPPTDFSCTP